MRMRAGTSGWCDARLCWVLSMWKPCVADFVSCWGALWCPITLSFSSQLVETFIHDLVPHLALDPMIELWMIMTYCITNTLPASWWGDVSRRLGNSESDSMGNIFCVIFLREAVCSVHLHLLRVEASQSIRMDKFWTVNMFVLCSPLNVRMLRCALDSLPNFSAWTNEST